MERQDGVRAPILVIVPAEYRVAGAPPASWYIDVKKRTLARTPVVPVKTVTGSLRVSTPEATALELLCDVAAAGYLSNVAPVLHELAEACDAGRLVEAAQTGPGGGAVRGSGARAHCVASPGGSTLTRGDEAMLCGMPSQVLETARQIPNHSQNHVHDSRLDVPPGLPSGDGVTAQT